MHGLKELQELFEDYLQKQEFEREPANLYSPFKYMLELPAKRLRPVMLMMACEMFGTSARKALPQAFAIELFHNFTLIHDDIMDQAFLRRGKPTIHKKFGQATAILSGDAMLVYAYQYLVQANSSIASQLLNVFNNCAVKVCEGQQLDMNFEKIENVRVKDYLKMIELKTATLIATALQIGAIIGGASHGDSKHLFEFGKELGISFQLKDDWLDAFGESKKIGKKKGGDIVQNKKTFLVLEALRIADTKKARQLKELYRSDSLSKKEKMIKVLSLFEEYDIRKVTESEISRHYKMALHSLDQIKLSFKKKKSLKVIATDLLTRQS